MHPFELVLLKLGITGTKWICSPACTELDHVVMDWAAQLFGLSEDFHNATRVGGGVIQVSGTIRCFGGSI